MLHVTATNLADEREFAVQLRSALLADFDEVVQRFHTSGYKAAGDDEGRDDPHNHALEIISTHLPAIAGGLPRVSFKSGRAGAAQVYARAHEVAANMHLRRSKGAKFREQVGVDFLLKYAVAIVTEKPLPGFSDVEDPPGEPTEQRVSPRDFFFDPVGLEPGTWRYSGHDLLGDQETMEEWAKDEASGWIAEEIRGATSVNQSYDDERGDERDGGPERTHIRYSQIWVPEATEELVKKWCPEAYDASDWSDVDEETHHGAIFTIALRGTGKDRQGVHLRRPYPYFGPADGPYAIEGILIVPDEGAPMSIATATKGVADTLNSFKKAHDDAMESWKRIFGVSGEDPAMADKVAAALNGEVVIFENLTELGNRLAQIELGGPSQDMLTSVTLQQEDYDRMVGISDAMRGNVTGAGTATEVATANAFGTRRTGWIEHKYRLFTSQIETKKAWFRHHSEKFAVVIGESEVDGGLPPMLMVGGTDVAAQLETLTAMHPELGESNLEALLQQMQGQRPSFDSLEIELDPWSMKHEDENSRLQRAQMLDQAIAMHATWMIQFPFLPHRQLWQEKMRLLGATGSVGEPDFELAAQVAGLMLGSQQPVEAQPQKPQQPRLVAGSTTAPTGPVGGNFFGASNKKPSAESGSTTQKVGGVPSV